MNPSTMGERIRTHRKRLGLTQEQLAERLGVSAQAVSKWENNLSCPDISILPELAKVFGISVDQLLGDDSGPAKEAEPLHQHQERSGFHWEWDPPKKTVHGILFAFFILVYGGLLLVNHLLQIDISWWTLLWTLGLVYIGANGLCHKFSFFFLIASLAGLFFLLDAYALFSFELGWGALIPILLILWGLSLLLDVLRGKKKPRVEVHGNGKRSTKYRCENGYLECELNFGSQRVAVETPLLRGGNIECDFGQYTVDFSACAAVAENCRISVDNNFGNMTLLVPEKYQVELHSCDNFAAAAEIKGRPASVPEGTILLEIDNNFGAINIVYT